MHGHHHRIAEWLRFVQHAYVDRIATHLQRHDLVSESEGLVEYRLPIAGNEQRLRAARVNFARRLLRLCALRADGDDAIESFVAQILFEFFGGKLEMLRQRTIADDRAARFLDAQQSRRIVPFETGDGAFAAVVANDELLDDGSVARRSTPDRRADWR